MHCVVWDSLESPSLSLCRMFDPDGPRAKAAVDVLQNADNRITSAVTRSEYFAFTIRRNKLALLRPIFSQAFDLTLTNLNYLGNRKGCGVPMP
jgi:hypothetical protein